MPSALFVSQYHHFSPVIYFIAISVLLAPSLPPPLPTTAPPPPLAHHHLLLYLLHLLLHAFATTGSSPPSPVSRHSASPRGSSQAFHPGLSVPTFLTACLLACLLLCSLARSLASQHLRRSKHSTTTQRDSTLPLSSPSCHRRSLAFIIPFCPFSFLLPPRPDIAVRQSPLPKPIFCYSVSVVPRPTRSHQSPYTSAFLFPFFSLPFLFSAHVQTRIESRRVLPLSRSFSRVLVRCSVSCSTSGTRKRANAGARR